MVNIAFDLDNTLIFSNSWGTSFINKDMEQLLLKLCKEEHKFYIITARMDEHRKETYEVAKQIEEKLNIKFEEIVLTEGRAKCKFAEELRCKFLIDDYKECFSDNLIYSSVNCIHYTDQRWQEIYKTICDIVALQNL